METPLGDFLEKFDMGTNTGRTKHEPWYNTDGDCIEFLAAQEAYVADRIDAFLTIYRSVENRTPIGFQIKDVMALVEKCGVDGLKVECEVDGEELISVSALLFEAFGSERTSIARRQGYAMASQALTGDRSRDQVALAIH